MLCCDIMVDALPPLWSPSTIMVTMFPFVQD
jgi:hypothetical protein